MAEDTAVSHAGAHDWCGWYGVTKQKDRRDCKIPGCDAFETRDHAQAWEEWEDQE